AANCFASCFCKVGRWQLRPAHFIFLATTRNFLLTRLGLEPRTHCLKGIRQASTDSAWQRLFCFPDAESSCHLVSPTVPESRLFSPLLLTKLLTKMGAQVTGSAFAWKAQTCCSGAAHRPLKQDVRPSLSPRIGTTREQLANKDGHRCL